MPRSPQQPKYRLHKARNCAVVRIDGKDHYLGPYDSPESHEKYARLISEWRVEAAKAASVDPRAKPTPLSINELILLYWPHVQEYYVKNGKPTSEQMSIRLALRPVSRLYGRSRTVDFGPLALKAVREEMINAGITRKRINQHVSRICRMFEWGVSQELIPVTVLHALKTVKGLRRGRTSAKESQPVRPVSEAHVNAVLPFLTKPLQAMVGFQRLTGCRPEEACLLRPCDVNRTSEVWEYVPESHKTEHHGKRRLIFIGPKCQAHLALWLQRPPDAYCFSPKEARTQFDADRRRHRKTPRTPSSESRERKARPRKQPGEHYTTCSYGQAIRNACDKAGIPRWSPNQLRHSKGTEIRRGYGIEGSQVVLGHANAKTTEIYAERDFELARRIMQAIG